MDDPLGRLFRSARPARISVGRKILRNLREGCVAAIARIAGKKWAITKVLAVFQAIAALTACVAEPRNAHARADA